MAVPDAARTFTWMKERCAGLWPSTTDPAHVLVFASLHSALLVIVGAVVVVVVRRAFPFLALRSKAVVRSQSRGPSVNRRGHDILLEHLY